MYVLLSLARLGVRFSHALPLLNNPVQCFTAVFVTGLDKVKMKKSFFSGKQDRITLVMHGPSVGGRPELVRI